MVTAVQSCVASLEALGPRDRGVAVARLSRLYGFTTKSCPQAAVTAAPQVGSSATAVPKAFPVCPSKTEWKKAWEQTPEFKALASLQKGAKTKTLSESDKALFAQTKLRAFRLRDEIQARHTDSVCKRALGASTTAEAEVKQQGATLIQASSAQSAAVPCSAASPRNGEGGASGSDTDLGVDGTDDDPT